MRIADAPDLPPGNRPTWKWCLYQAKKDVQREPPWWIIIFDAWPSLHASMKPFLVIDYEQAWWKGFVDEVLERHALQSR